MKASYLILNQYTHTDKRYLVNSDTKIELHVQYYAHV